MVPKTFPDNSSNSAALALRANRVLPGGNTRLTIYYAPHPVYADRGQGAYVFDVDGQKYLDLVCNYSAAIHGQNFGPVTDAIQKQIERLGAVGMPTAAEIELAELLVGRVRSIDQLRFCNSGTEAVMFAVKAARAYTGRPKIAKIEGAYHGSYDAVEVSMAPGPRSWGPEDRPTPVAYSQGTPQGVLDDTIVLPFNQPDIARRLIAETGGDLAAVLIDPAMSRLGYLPATDEFLDTVQSSARAVGALVIADEVYSFRLGYHGAQTLIGLAPDITALGKIIGGGIPIGAVGGRGDIMSVFSPAAGRPKAPHGGTFNGNPLAMAAGLAAMNALTPEAFAHLDNLGDRLRSGLRSLSTPNRPIQVTGRGSLTSMVFASEPFTNYRELAVATPEHTKIMTALHAECIRRGLMIATGGQLVLSTPMTEADIDFALEVIGEGLDAAA